MHRIQFSGAGYRSAMAIGDLPEVCTTNCGKRRRPASLRMRLRAWTRRNDDGTTKLTVSGGEPGAARHRRFGVCDVNDTAAVAKAGDVKIRLEYLHATRTQGVRVLGGGLQNTRLVCTRITTNCCAARLPARTSTASPTGEPITSPDRAADTPAALEKTPPPP